MVVSGYLHPGYAASLAEFGEPRLLPISGAWVLQRSIGGSPHRDAIGCYPLFGCINWERLSDDLDAIGSDLVALSTRPIRSRNPAPRPFGDRFSWSSRSSPTTSSTFRSGPRSSWTHTIDATCGKRSRT